MKAFTVWLVSLWAAWETSYFVRMSQSPAVRMATIPGDPIVVAIAGLLVVAWVCFYVDQKTLDAGHRQRVRVEGIYRRKYAGRPLAWLRAESRIHYAGLVLIWRGFPKPIRLMALYTYAAMFGIAAAGPTVFMFLLSGVRANRPKEVPASLPETLDAIDPTELLDRLQSYRPTGRQGYPLNALWRAYLLSFVLDLPSTNALIRRLHDDRKLRLLCGFSTLPHRTTFNRFIARLGHHRDLVEDCMAVLTARLRDLLPGLGEKVAVDSTTVRSHSNPHRRNRQTGQVSDPEASWTAKNSAGGKDQKEWSWGYKFHLMADATYGIPLFGYTTTASRNDSPELPRLMDKATETLSWLNPRYVMADKGYDSRANHEATAGHDAVLVCPARRKANSALYEGIYTEKGVPTCIGMVEMDYVRSDPQKGHLYRCRREACHLETRKGVRYCADEVWENRRDNPRLFGPLRQKSPKWKALYRLRQAVERVYKGMKESRRLERHCVRGLRDVSLHAAMSVLAFAATVLVQTLVGDVDQLWMVRRVA